MILIKIDILSMALERKPEPVRNVKEGKAEDVMHQPIKLYLLTGFLGAGKTTMLLSLLNGGGVAGKKIGVIQNEFGKLSIDGALLQRGGY